MCKCVSWAWGSKTHAADTFHRPNALVPKAAFSIIDATWIRGECRIALGNMAWVPTSTSHFTVWLCHCFSSFLSTAVTLGSWNVPALASGFLLIHPSVLHCGCSPRPFSSFCLKVWTKCSSCVLLTLDNSSILKFFTLCWCYLFAYLCSFPDTSSLGEGS